MFRTSNPTLKEDTFTKPWDRPVGSSVMTLEGAVNKTALLLAILTITAGWTWNQFFVNGAEKALPLTLVGAFGGFIVAIITSFAMRWSPITSPIYAALEGLFLGGFSALLETRYPGIVIQAVGLTFGVLFALLMAYKSGMIKATENFKLGVVAATGGILLLYIVGMALSFFHIQIPYIHQSGPIGIGFSLFVVVIASLNLVLDFDFIENGAKSGAPKFMEWYAAFGLLVTLVWLYVEIIRLLAKLRGRR